MLLHVSSSLRLPLIDEIEEYLYDVRLRWDMPNTVDDRIVIVDIDERSIAAEGHFPWQRDKMARLVEALFDYYRVRVVAFDMVFAEPEESTALQLIEELRNRSDLDTGDIPLDELHTDWQTDRKFAESVTERNVILGFTFKEVVTEREPATTGLLPFPTIYAEQLEGISLPLYEAEGYVGNFAGLQEVVGYGGFFSYPRLDDIIRSTPLLQAYQGDLYETLSLAAARLYLGNPPIQFEFGEGGDYTGLNLENLLLGEYRIPVDERTRAFIPFRGPLGSFPYISATDVLNREAGIAILRDKLVIVGTTSAGLLDLRSTPVSDAYAGVEIHANLASAVLDQRFMASPTYITGVELVVIVSNLLLMATVIPLLSPVLIALTLTTLLLVNTSVNVNLWNSHQLIVPLSATLIAILTMAFLQITYNYFGESRRKQRLGRMFGQYIPAEVVEEIDASGQELSLEGESREMTVLFSDVRGFTTISENLEPAELTRFMNEFLTPITRVIHDKRGTIDKYIGDAVMAFWGAPLRDDRHAEHAVTAALEMIQAMQEVTRDFLQKGWPPIQIGIGVSSGPMSVGNMGSEFRMAYTVMGDVVNLGSRLEGQTKTYGVNIIISQETAVLLEGFALREIDLVRVKGKTVPVKIFEPLGRSADLTVDQNLELADYHRALSLYRDQKFEQARSLFRELQANHACRLYELYLERINSFLQSSPGGDWDGVFVAQNK
jgi:adenylate cyclase